MALKNKNISLYWLLLIFKNYKIKKLIKKKQKNYLPKIYTTKPLVKSNNLTPVTDKNLNIVYKFLILQAYYNQFKYVNDKWLLNLYLKNLTYYYLNINLNWRFINLITTLNKDFLNKLWYKIYKKKYFGLLYGKKKKTLTWFLQLYKLKDPQGIIFVITKILFKANLKKHRKFFFLIGAFFKMLYINKEKKNSLKGLTLYFKGKLGKKGSVRKTKFKVKYGVGSRTNKNLRVNYRTYVIVTITGVVGCNITLYYK